MPRPNPPRTRKEERLVAEYLVRERKRRGWSQGEVANRMTDVGCPIAPTAIHKIEKGDPPRHISVDELAAFAEVFQTPISVLIGHDDYSEEW